MGGKIENLVTGGWTIEVSTRALRAGRWVDEAGRPVDHRQAGARWEPYGQVLHRLQYDGPRSGAEELAERLRHTPPGEEAWAAEIRDSE